MHDPQPRAGNVDHLQRDARATSAELGEIAGLSASPAHRRQKLLEESGVIRQYVALLDQERVGLPVNVFVSVRLSAQTDEHLRAFEQAITDCPEIMEAYVMSGASDYLLRVVVKDTRDYERLLREKLYKIKGIQHSQAMCVLRTLKRTELPLGG